MSILEIRAGGRFKLKQKIGSGSFGDIYLAQNTQTGDEFAVKMEESNTKYPQLIYEAKIIHSLQGGVGIPTLIWCGQEGEYNVLIMELLGEDLESLLNLCKRRMTLKTILMLTEQILTTLEYIHAKGFLHRDLKPENLLMGSGNSSQIVHVIDYGLSKRYRDPKTGKHIPFREGKSLTGTARYASISTHQGKEQSRRDDLEALGYILVYLFKGSLPWQGLPAPTKKSKYELIMQKKMETTLDDLCSDMPGEFKTYLEYCKKLKFEDKPDYHYLKRMFKELFIRLGFENDTVYDWLLIPWNQRVGDEQDYINGKFMIDLEFSANDEVTNYNLCNLQEYVVHTGHGNGNGNGKPNVMPNQQGHTNNEKEDNDSNGGGNEKKKAIPEYLRTELKSDNRKPFATGAGAASPNKSRSASSPKLQTKASFTNPKEKEKKSGKDCNMF